MFLAFSLPFLDPPQVQRMLMARNGNQIKKTFRIDALIELPFFIIVGIIGLIAVAMDPIHDANLAFPHLINSILPFGIRGFAIIGLLSVVMSTADSYLNSSGISLVRDTIKPLYKGKFTDKNELFLTQLATFFIGTMATIISLSFKTILDIILFSLNFWAPIMIVPLSAALMGINAGARSFYVGAISGVSMFLFWHFLIEPIIEVDSLFPSILANALGFWISYRLKSKNTHSAPSIHQPLATH
jgi:SSS family solute:Na+ symporter